MYVGMYNDYEQSIWRAHNETNNDGDEILWKFINYCTLPA